MDKGWNKEHEFFPQSYEGQDIADSAVLIMPLVSRPPFRALRPALTPRDPLPCSFQCFFISASDPRFRKTLDRILSPPEKGGLQQNNVGPSALRQGRRNAFADRALGPFSLLPLGSSSHAMTRARSTTASAAAKDPSRSARSGRLRRSPGRARTSPSSCPRRRPCSRTC
jgi:hypothetical protein